jgi:hypothetical protein
LDICKKCCNFAADFRENDGNLMLILTFKDKKIMKKVLFLAVVAMCAMACGKCGDKCDKQDTVKVDTPVVEQVVDTPAVVAVDTVVAE